MNSVGSYLAYLSTQKRYSPRTVSIYADVLRSFFGYAVQDDASASDDDRLLTCNVIRAYNMYLADERHLSARTVNLHLSVLSGYCSFLVRRGELKSNPVSSLIRPRSGRKLPVYYRREAMEAYLKEDNVLSRRDFEMEMETEEERRETYNACLSRIIVSILYSCGIRRAELIGLKVGSVDFSRKIMRVRGKGDKMRDIPLVDGIIEEILLYLHSVEFLVKDVDRSAVSPLLVTWSGRGIYPVLVDRAVKKELGVLGNMFSGRKSPHALRHTLATSLLDNGADIWSIKEVLGHANLAATQVYTHTSVSQLKKIYESAHPRAKSKGGKNGN